jgi:hypothetical protein
MMPFLPPIISQLPEREKERGRKRASRSRVECMYYYLRQSRVCSFSECGRKLVWFLVILHKDICPFGQREIT